MQDIWKDHFDNDTLGSIVKDMRVVVQLADRQCFGMVRKSITEEIKTRLVMIRRKLDNFEQSLPKENTEISIHVAFAKGVAKVLQENKHAGRS